MLFLVFAADTLGFARSATAQAQAAHENGPKESGNADLTASAPKYRMSINVSGLIALGAVWPTIEYFIDDHDTLLLEGAYYVFGPAAGDYEAGVGYRRYLFAPNEGVFLGGFARAGHQRGTVRNGKYSYETPFGAVGANGGYKWQWDNGLCFTTRLGYGYPITDIKWTPERPAGSIAPLTAAIMGLDADLAVGYSF
jgi:hypothetical protein